MKHSHLLRSFSLGAAVCTMLCAGCAADETSLAEAESTDSESPAVRAPETAKEQLAHMRQNGTVIALDESETTKAANYSFHYISDDKLERILPVPISSNMCTLSGVSRIFRTDC